MIKRAASLSQVKGAEEPEFLLCRDVRSEQQRGAQTLQNLGGEENPQLALSCWPVQTLTDVDLFQRIPNKTKRIYCAYERLMVNHAIPALKLLVCNLPVV